MRLRRLLYIGWAPNVARSKCPACTAVSRQSVRSAEELDGIGTAYTSQSSLVSHHLWMLNWSTHNPCSEETQVPLTNLANETGEVVIHLVRFPMRANLLNLHPSSGKHNPRTLGSKTKNSSGQVHFIELRLSPDHTSPPNWLNSRYLLSQWEKSLLTWRQFTDPWCSWKKAQGCLEQRKRPVALQSALSCKDRHIAWLYNISSSLLQRQGLSTLCIHVLPHQVPAFMSW